MNGCQIQNRFFKEKMSGTRSELTWLTALVVDDDELTRQTIAKMISRLGVGRVLQACDGHEALQVLERGAVDIVLADVNMPRINGLSMLETIKGRWPYLPVIMLSGCATMKMAVEAMRLGATDFIVKPFKLEDLEVPLERAARERLILLKNRELREELAKKEEVDRLNRKLERKLSELSKLYAISEAINPAKLEGQMLFQKLVDLAAEITECKGASLAVLDQRTNRLITKAARGGKRDWVEDDIFPALEVNPQLFQVSRMSVAITRLEGKGRTFGASWIASVPIIIGEEVFGVLNVWEKSSGGDLTREDATLLKALAQRASLAIENQALYEGLYATLTDTLLCLVSTIEAKDPNTKHHSQRVTRWALTLARAMGFSQEEQDLLRLGSYLHDIGKIGIKDWILMKPDTLTPEEMEVIKTHPVIGEKIVSHLGLLPVEKSIIRHHHERWDGTGYPDGLKGEEIPLPARIVAVADVLDAVSSNRVYRRARPLREALEEIAKGAGTQFDPQVVEVLMDLSKDISCPQLEDQ
jgi:putative nucleotidyltransferase with HDIG domain